MESDVLVSGSVTDNEFGMHDHRSRRLRWPKTLIEPPLPLNPDLPEERKDPDRLRDIVLLFLKFPLVLWVDW